MAYFTGLRLEYGLSVCLTENCLTRAPNQGDESHTSGIMILMNDWTDTFPFPVRATFKGVSSGTSGGCGNNTFCAELGLGSFASPCNRTVIYISVLTEWIEWECETCTHLHSLVSHAAEGLQTACPIVITVSHGQLQGLTIPQT